jgi:hypothetical protein
MPAALAQQRALTRDQLTVLFFGSKRRCQAALAHLKQVELIRHVVYLPQPLAGAAPRAYILTGEGARVAAQVTGINRKSWAFALHEPDAAFSTSTTRWPSTTSTSSCSRRLAQRAGSLSGSARTKLSPPTRKTENPRSRRTAKPLELVRGFAAAVKESTPEAQREVVQRVFQRIAITDDRVTDVDVYPVYAEALRWYWRPQPDKFRTATELRNGNLAR